MAFHTYIFVSWKGEAVYFSELNRVFEMSICKIRDGYNCVVFSPEYHAKMCFPLNDS